MIHEPGVRGGESAGEPGPVETGRPFLAALLGQGLSRVAVTEGWYLHHELVGPVGRVLRAESFGWSRMARQDVSRSLVR